MQTDAYLPLIKGKKVAVTGNNTTVIGKTHLVDSLLKLDVNIVKVFCPEHGFRGQAEAGEQVDNAIDATSGLPIVSLYGSHKKPLPADLKGIDIMLFDIQDVGVRFFTYISTLHYMMEACAEQGIPVLILDRPNPNGHYIDGPILLPEHKSFVGMHPVPIVHGMTIGEYAQMINGEGWLKNSIKCKLTVISCKNYTHQSRYTLPVNPSPNLQTMKAIYLYSSICLFEGTPFSLGRGTDFPFMVFGHPKMQQCNFHFTPRSISGVSSNPPLLGLDCCGVDLRMLNDDDLANRTQIDLSWLLFAYRNFPEKDKFFIPFFDTLAGTTTLRKQIASGASEQEIRKSWEKGLSEYRQMSKKYLIYE